MLSVSESDVKKLGKKRANRHDLVAKYEEVKEARFEMIRELVVVYDRVDILADHVLYKDGDPCMWFHKEMIDFQHAYEEGIILGFRGARKSSYCTIAWIIYLILKDPNVRVLIASEAADQARTLMRGVKSQFERNDLLRSLFGDYFSEAAKWTDNEIIVSKRTSYAIESTVTCAGIETRLPGRHFDYIIADDLVTEENSATEGQRAKVKTYFYKTLMPCLETDGKLHVIGTRWHEEDLYGWLIKEDYKESNLVIPVLDEETEQSIWEEKFPTKRMHRIRRGSLAAFELQWMCRSSAGTGGIFVESHFLYYDDLPPNHFKWQGVDLAAGQKARNDFFAHVTVAIEKTTREIYLVKYHEEKIPFPKQVRFIDARFREFPDSVRVGVEANAYQIVMTQQLREMYPDIPTVPVYTLKDKVARANQLSQMASLKPIRIRRQHHKFLRRMCGFPNGPKDMFDAFDIACSLATRGVKRKRRSEPGLI
jgi:hypothetical protein